MPHVLGHGSKGSYTVNNLISIFAVLALTVQVVAVVVWCFCWRKINMKVWSAVFFGFTIMFLHRIIEILRLSEAFSVITANGIALVALIATVTVYKFVRHAEAIRKALKLGGHATECVAEKLAEHLGELRDEIHWYEDQAKTNGLPRYPK